MVKCPRCNASNYRDLHTKLLDGDEYKWVYQCNECGMTFTEKVLKVNKPFRNGKQNRSAVIQYKNGEPIARYDSIMIAYRETGIHYTCICNCCCGRSKTAGGYVWRYDNRENE